MIEFRQSGQPFKVYTLRFVIDKWLLAETTRPSGVWRLHSYGNVILLTDSEKSEPSQTTIGEALALIKAEV